MMLFEILKWMIFIICLFNFILTIYISKDANKWDFYKIAVWFLATMGWSFTLTV